MKDQSTPYTTLETLRINLQSMQQQIEYVLPILDILSNSEEGKQALQKEAATIAALITEREAELCKSK